MTTKRITNARDLLARHGRNGDTELAHISPSERRIMRAWQGREDVNPHTGLPEYFKWKKVLKGVAKAAGAAAGAYFGGPAGAAVGGALATKLTGGSWKSALGTGLLSGISAYGVQQSGLGDTMGISSLGSGADLLGRTGASSGLGSLLGGAGKSGFDVKSLLPVAAIGIGALAGGAKTPKTATAQQPLSDTGGDWESKPLDRKYQQYSGDYATYGQDGGQYQFYDEVNPTPQKLASGGIARFKYGGDTREGGVTGHDRGRAGMEGHGGGRGAGPDKDTLDKIRGAYSDPSRQNDTIDNARVARDIMARGDPTTVEGMLNRRPGMLEGITNIVNGVATPNDVAQVGAQAVGAITGAPVGSLVGTGIGMGNAVKDVQAMRDIGALPGSTESDDSMGRVDTVRGEGYSMGNPASDDRAENSSGLGGGMTGGRGDGAQVLATLTQAFALPAAAGIPTGGIGTPLPGQTPPPASTGRKYQDADNYYTYGQTTPEWEFFDKVNAARGGHVSGEGDGQDDKIPAMLSDGEYVLDAQTVASIGSGSTNAGVKKLDKWREDLRKKAGFKNHKTIPPKSRGIGSLGRAA